MSDSSVQIYKAHELVQSGAHLADVVLADGGEYEMYVETDGLAERVSVGTGNRLSVQYGGVAADVLLCVDGIMDVQGNSRCDGAEVLGLARLSYGALLEDGVVRDGGGLMALTGSTVSRVSILDGGYLYASGNSLLQGVEAASGAKLDISSSRLENAVFSAGAQYDLSQCVLANCTLKGDFDALPGKELSLEGLLTLTGRCRGIAELDVSSTTLTFSLVDRVPNADAFLDALPADAAGYAAIAAEQQPSGSYALAENADGFDQTLSLSTNGATPFTATFSLGETVAAERTRYTLSLDANNTLSLTVANRQVLRLSRGTMSAECDGGWWNPETPAVSVYSRSATAVAETRDWFAEGGTAANTQLVKLADAPSRIVAEGDGVADLFLAEPSGVWTSSYQAQNTYTGALASITGKNRFSDIFIGASDHTVLMLTDGADALFADDIYSALGGSRENRLQGIAEIHAGAGDDVIDLTCANVATESAGCLLDGGDGNDILWGGEQAATIIGGAGDDTLVSQRDGVQFLFGENWGRDTVQVGDGLDFTLRFAEGTQLSIAYDDFGARLSCGNDSVAVQGVYEGIESRIAYGALAAAH